MKTPRPMRPAPATDFARPKNVCCIALPSSFLFLLVSRTREREIDGALSFFEAGFAEVVPLTCYPLPQGVGWESSIEPRPQAIWLPFLSRPLRAIRAGCPRTGARHIFAYASETCG